MLTQNPSSKIKVNEEIYHHIDKIYARNDLHLKEKSANIKSMEENDYGKDNKLCEVRR